MKKERNAIDTEKFPFPDDKRLRDVKFIVMDDEPYNFWEKYRFYVKYEQDSSGFGFKYHEFSKNKPCWATAWFAMVNDERTMFIEASGGYIDWPKLEAYVFAMVGMTPAPDNHTNGTNLHNHYMLLARNIEARGKGLLLELEEKKRDVERIRHYLEKNEWYQKEVKAIKWMR